MTALLILIPVSVLLGLVGLAAFIWTLKSDQYRDLEGDAARILFSDKGPAAENAGRGAPPDTEGNRKDGG